MTTTEPAPPIRRQLPFRVLPPLLPNQPVELEYDRKAPPLKGLVTCRVRNDVQFFPQLLELIGMYREMETAFMTHEKELDERQARIVQLEAANRSLEMQLRELRSRKKPAEAPKD